MKHIQYIRNVYHMFDFAKAESFKDIMQKYDLKYLISDSEQVIKTKRVEIIPSKKPRSFCAHYRYGRSLN